jgi:hypothetical protein
MKTPPTTPRPPTSLPDWLNDCSFQSRQDSLGLTPGILAHHVKKSAPPESSHRDFAAGTGVTALGERGLVSVTNQKFGRVLESSTMKTSSKSSNNEVLSELRTLRQLSSQVFDPPSERDFLPEMILFGLIGVLCAAWPIFSMLTAMAGRH